MEKTCKRCGNTFQATHSRRIYCSRTCSNLDSNDLTRARFLEKPKTTVWSCGGGVDSTAIAVLIVQGELPKPDYAVMIDVGYEPKSTWDHVEDVLKPRLLAVGVELLVLHSADWTDTALVDHRGWCCLPAYRIKDGEVQKLTTRCSGNWKAKVARRWLREQGIDRCEQWLGIAADEQKRAKPAVEQWTELRWPLIEFGMTREDCVWLIGKAGWPPTPRTSCYLCPQHTDSEWRRLMDSAPEDFEKGCEAERVIQEQCADIYLHRFCVPLGEAVSRLRPTALGIGANGSCGACGSCDHGWRCE